MAWTFRRSVTIGPLRVNASKSGVGMSAGVRGARVGVDAKGRRYRFISIPGTGIYNREYLPSKPKPKAHRRDHLSIFLLALAAVLMRGCI